MATKKTGGIVEGYARSWPREIFDRDGKIAKEADFLKQPGVYVLYDNGRPHYIGQGASMYGRLKTYTLPRSRYYNFWNAFSAFAVKDAKARAELEAILIAAMPTANSAKPKLNKMKLPRRVAALMKKIRDAKIPR